MRAMQLTLPLPRAYDGWWPGASGPVPAVAVGTMSRLRLWLRLRLQLRLQREMGRPVARSVMMLVAEPLLSLPLLLLPLCPCPCWL